jgi:hypothetical protein
MNHAANEEYAASVANDGVLAMPVLFLAAAYDIRARLWSPP